MDKRSGALSKFIVALGAVFMWQVACKSSEPTTAEIAADADRDAQIWSWTMCKESVKARLKAPATAEFPWVEHNITTEGNGEFTVISHVDAQNSFGALIRSNFTCRAKATKDGARVLSIVGL